MDKQTFVMQRNRFLLRSMIISQTTASFALSCPYAWRIDTTWRRMQRCVTRRVITRSISQWCVGGDQLWAYRHLSTSQSDVTLTDAAW